MAFGQVSGSPASAKQVRELLDLLQAAGHRDFRDARGPMGFTQRQAGGKFSRDEAQAYIDQLEAEAEDSPPASAPPMSASKAVPKSAPAPKGVPKGAPAPKSSAPKPAVAARPAPSAAAEPSGRPLTPMERALRAATGDQLADELRRRGWRTVER
jgi:hypothetical protein